MLIILLSDPSLYSQDEFLASSITHPFMLIHIVDALSLVEISCVDDFESFIH